ncbi:uncharacterized protein At4g22758-like [Impatiens glandulifera]|uniref:uncharacterized protein At4g22758-like n=1 Tax=Impatiens glandulifera TaxID=253017 RepID=UPI001FB0BB16|nr:uncharacterized protein At4g22758-like [Impatiens glandulifera]
MLLIRKQKKIQTGNRILISITFHGSAGPIRLIVGEDEIVAGVIEKALKSYGQQGRLPILGSDLNNFVLYSSIEALDPLMKIGSVGSRSFLLCKKVKMEKEAIEEKIVSRKKKRSAWTWLNKSLNSKISVM